MDSDAAVKGVRTGAAHHCADKLLKEAKISTSPVRIKDLIPFIKKDFDGTTFLFSGTKGLPPGIGLPDGVYALTHRFGNNVLIAYNENVAVNRQKFSVAHELGHLYMGHVHGGMAIDLESKEDGEIEANQFAAQLLIPSKFLRKDVVAGMKNPKQLAAHYEVSEEAIWLRLQETGIWKQL